MKSKIARNYLRQRGNAIHDVINPHALEPKSCYIPPITPLAAAN